ncbi:MAG: archaeosortase/exosortase family protein [Deltaproteobacteria bacterium]|nr:archaeosortase/exosortase family protein [Deltaproteobacteria bacterium]
MRAVVAVVAVVVVAAPLVPWFLLRSGDPEAFAGLCCQLAALIVGVVVCQRAPGAPARARLSLAMGALLLLGGVLVDVRIVQMGGVLFLAHAAVAFIAPTRVRALVPVLLLLLLGLPLAGDLDVLGFPARLFAARMAHAVLTLGGLQVIGAETVLVVEGNVADVEAPCAGLATLRVLAIVVLISAALRSASLGRTAGAVVVAGVVAVLGNAARVTVLAALALAAQRNDFARLVHVPLGVVVFVGAVFVADLVLRSAPAASSRRPRAPSRLDLALLVVIALIASGLRLSSSNGPAREHPIYEPSVDAIPLTAAEEGLFGRHAWFAEKRAIEGGTALLVVASSLRAHHAPERCLAGSGLRIDASTTTTIAGIPVKRLVLDGGARIGISFFVRDDEGAPVVTATLLDRAADQLLHRRQGPWAFVSVVVDGAADVDALVPALLSSAHARVVARRGASLHLEDR